MALEIFRLFGSIFVDNTKANQSISKTDSAAQMLAKKFSNVGDTFQNVGSALSKVGAKITATVTAPIIALGVKSAHTATEFVKLYESTMIVFERMLGGKQIAQDLYESLLMVARASTYSQETFLKAGKSLVGVGVSAEKTTRYLKVITDQISALGGTESDIESITDAFSKMRARGKVSLMEIQSLTAANINAIAMLASQYGVSTDAMSKMISKGLIPSEEAMDKLCDAMQNGYMYEGKLIEGTKGMADALKSKTLTGALDSLNTGFRTFALNLLGMNPVYEQGQKQNQKLAEVISKFATILPKFANIFGNVSSGISGLLDQLSEKLDKLNDWLDNTDKEKLAKIGDIILKVAAAGPALLIAGKAISGIGGAISGIGGAIGFLGKLDPKIMLITAAVAALAGAFALCSTQGDDLVNNLSAKIPEFTKKAVDSINDFLKMLSDKIPEVLPKLLDGFTTLMSGFADAMPEITDKLVTALNSLFETLLDQLPVMLPKILEAGAKIHISLLKATVQLIYELVKTLLIKIYEAFFKKEFEEMVESFNKAWLDICATWDGAVEFFQEVWRGIVKAFSNVSTWFSETFNSAWENVRLTWSNATSWFSGIWENIKSTFSGVSTWFSGIFKDAWNAIKNVFSGWGDFFSGLWNRIVSTFSEIGSKISNAIGGAVKSGLNGVLGIIEKTINGGINLINGAIGLINNIPGVDIGKMSELRLPRLARGGVLYEPTLFKGGEYPGARRNPEIVTPENKMYEVVTKALNSQNNSLLKVLEKIFEQTKEINSTLYSKFVAALVDGVELSVDNREIARLIKRYSQA